LVKDRRIISSGYCGAPTRQPHCDSSNCNPDNPCKRTVHAEANTIAFAAKHGISTNGCYLYTTLSPCIDCAKLLVNAGIEAVFFLERYRDDAGLKVLENSETHWFHHVWKEEERCQILSEINLAIYVDCIKKQDQSV